MTQPKKLIEAALPIKEISAESVRDKSIRHGHLSTLHLWWARRPLPVCRAVVFASLVPDPLDEQCPPAFCEAVELLLGKAQNPGDPYKPYDDIPWTSADDPMEDNLRNRLQMFIGKFTPEMQQHLRHNAPKPPAGKQLSDASLIKWDNKNNEEILTKARKLIFVAHNAGGGVLELLAEFDVLYAAIKQAERDLYALPDRHLPGDEREAKQAALDQAIEAFLSRMPNVFDPFAGGGAIPLEAARLGCRSFGNDLNPVAHIIQKGSLEFPQKFGKPITYSKAEFIRLYGAEEFLNISNEHKVFENGQVSAVRLPNQLSFDVAFYAKKLLAAAEAEIGHLYPDNPGKPHPQPLPEGEGSAPPSFGGGPGGRSAGGGVSSKPIAYYWARVGACANPACRADVPLLKGFYLCHKPGKQVYLNPIITGTQIDFEIKQGKCDLEGWNNRGNLKCPCCGSITDVKQIKQQNIDGSLGERLLAVIIDGQTSKEYRIPTETEINVVKNIPHAERPIEKMQRNSAGGDMFSWGVTEWGQLFSPRQLYALHTLVAKLNNIKAELKPQESEYAQAVVTYLGILMDRIAVANTSFGVWHVGRETLERPMGRQAIPMVFDYPESNPFCDSSGSTTNQLKWLTRYIESESEHPFAVDLKNASSGDKSQFSDKFLTAVITDPPYYDAIAYADLSDFFYVWLKRTLADVYPLNFATPQTPKSDECTALKHHHNGKLDAAKQHFEQKLLQIFDAIEHQTSDLVSIMFAHQSTEAWTTLCNSILGARMNITGSWANDTEMTGALKTDKSYLSSSVTVACKPSLKQGYGDYKDVKQAIETTVARQVDALYRLGFRGADLLTACFGQAVSEFGKYNTVEKADGSAVSVAELLDLAKESAFNALLKGFDGDDYTKFYIAWLQLYSFTQSDFDDAAKFSRVGLNINVADLFKEHILIQHGNTQTLATCAERMDANKRLGERANNFLIDQVHRAMFLYKHSNRASLLAYIGKAADRPDRSFWRVVTALCEVLPKGCDDHTQAAGLLTNKESLIRQSKQAPTATQADLF
jgi:putative DNA methylase